MSPEAKVAQDNAHRGEKGNDRPPVLRIAELHPGMRPDGVVVVKKKVRREQQDGSRYLLFQLGDSSGQINAILWHGAEIVDAQIAAGDLAHVRGEVQLYQNTRQIKVQRMERADPSRYDLSQFLRTSENDLEALYERLLGCIDSVRNPWLQRLYSDIFRDPDLRQHIQSVPAGKAWHHAYVGGLLEHVLSMLDLGETLQRTYPRLDRDVLIGGILLHDIGKIEELTLRSYIDYTTPGRLLGHLVQGCLLVSRCMDRIDGFPEELRTRVLHTIVAHHGEVEHGSPKPPMTLEAMAVHLLDHLDSQVQAVDQVTSESRSSDGWSEHLKLLNRSLYRGADSGDGAAS